MEAVDTPADKPRPHASARLCATRAFAWLLLAAVSSPGSVLAATPELESARAFVANYCADCHDGEDAEGGLDLGKLSLTTPTPDERAVWRRVVTAVRDHAMPPRDTEQPELELRGQFTDVLESALHVACCGDGIQPAPALTRRLNRQEYGNTVRDLLDIHVNVALILPDDGAGGEGFDNAAETLFLSPIHGEKYLEAAQTALRHALGDAKSRAALFPDGDTPEDSMRAALATFLPRAFRRPVAQHEQDNYLSLFRRHFAQSQSESDARALTLAAVLVSPNFLFRVELPNPEPGPQLLADHELASRLSYFLWASTPDSRLLESAQSGTLQEPDVLRGEVRRMLDGGNIGRSANKVSGFAHSFMEQWLGTRVLGREFKPDPSVSRTYDAELEGGLKYEPVLFFEDILVNNRSILELIDADFTYANKHVAKHYGISGEFREQPKRVELPEESLRGGVLGMGAVLAISSHPHRTSPVLRGKWILETLLGTPPPPAPPDVPALEEHAGEGDEDTLRARLERHRADPACASCHDRIDPLGFGLENFDVLGRYRFREGGSRIDATGKLPDGTEFTGIGGLKQVLLARKRQFARHFTAKVMGFALGRGLSDEDYCSVAKIVDDLEQQDYSAHTLIEGIVLSPSFRFKAGTNRALAVPEGTATSRPDNSPAGN